MFISMPMVIYYVYFSVWGDWIVSFGGTPQTQNEVGKSSVEVINKGISKSEEIL